MQVLVLVVQNAVGYEDLGVATSGATFFRSIGASFGVSIFGTVFTNRLGDKLRRRPRGAAAAARRRRSAARSPTRAAIAGLPAAVRPPVLHAYSLVHHRRLPVRGAGRARRLRRWPGSSRRSRCAARSPRPTPARPSPATPSSAPRSTRCARGLSVLGTREGRRELYRRSPRRPGSTSSRPPAGCCCASGGTARSSPPELAERSTVPLPVDHRGGRGRSRSAGSPRARDWRWCSPTRAARSPSGWRGPRGVAGRAARRLVGPGPAHRSGPAGQGTQRRAVRLGAGAAVQRAGAARPPASLSTGFPEHRLPGLPSAEVLAEPVLAHTVRRCARRSPHSRAARTGHGPRPGRRGCRGSSAWRRARGRPPRRPGPGARAPPLPRSSSWTNTRVSSAVPAASSRTPAQPPGTPSYRPTSNCP